MSHRNGKPKPNASERTKYRYRLRNDTLTEADKKRRGVFEIFKMIKKGDVKLG